MLLIALVATCLILAAPSSARGQQNNIVFTNIPDFLRLDWDIVLSRGERGDIVNAPGAVLAGNGLIMLSTKRSPRLLSEYLEIEIERVVQYNLPRPAGSLGYTTLFHLEGKTSDVIIRPGVRFWTFSVRHNRYGPYVSYVAILSGHEQTLRGAGTFEREIESQRKILRDLYASYAKGLE